MTVSYGYIVLDVVTQPEMARDIARLIATINSN